MSMYDDDWEEALNDAKEELGLSTTGYLSRSNFLAAVELAKENLAEERRREASYQATCEHQDYLQSEEWKNKRLIILKRDNFKCVDCGKKATEVHHLNYNFLHTSEEEKYCVSLCKECHKKRHGIRCYH